MKAIAVPTETAAVMRPITTCARRYSRPAIIDQACATWVSPHATMKAANKVHSHGYSRSCSRSLSTHNIAAGIAK